MLTKNPSTLHVAIPSCILALTLLLGAGELAARDDHDRHGSRKGGAIPAVLATLERIEARLETLEEELIPCTPDRYRAGLCQENETPFDLGVSLCGNAGGQATVNGKLAFNSKTSLQGGAGWKEVLDVDLTVEGAIPGVLLLGGAVPIVLPSELALGSGGAVGLGLNGCLELTRIDIGPFVPRAQVLAMLDALEQGQEQLVTALAAAVAPGGPESTSGIGRPMAQRAAPPTFDTARLARALQAAQAFASADFQTDDPLDVLSSPEVRALRDALPVGGRLRGFMDHPDRLLPDVDPFEGVALCDRFPPGTIVGQKVDPVCGFLEDLPPFGEVRGVFDQFSVVQGDVTSVKAALEGLPEVIKTTVEDALPEVSTPTPPPPGNPFCNTFPNSPFC
jgi:hypothetical protein